MKAKITFNRYNKREYVYEIEFGVGDCEVIEEIDFNEMTQLIHEVKKIRLIKQTTYEGDFYYLFGLRENGWRGFRIALNTYNTYSKLENKAYLYERLYYNIGTS